jgi:hypothetical protein
MDSVARISVAEIALHGALIGLAIAFENLWPLMMLGPFALVIRYGVVAREEAYLERKFSDVYRGYRSRTWCSAQLTPGGPRRALAPNAKHI